MYSIHMRYACHLAKFMSQEWTISFALTSKCIANFFNNYFQTKKNVTIP